MGLILGPYQPTSGYQSSDIGGHLRPRREAVFETAGHQVLVSSAPPSPGRSTNGSAGCAIKAYSAPLAPDHRLSMGQEATRCSVFGQSDRALIGLDGAAGFAAPLQQIGACDPIGLVRRDA